MVIESKEMESGSNDLVSVVKFVIHETCDDAGFSHRLITQEHQFVLCKSWYWCHFHCPHTTQHTLNKMPLLIQISSFLSQPCSTYLC